MKENHDWATTFSVLGICATIFGIVTHIVSNIFRSSREIKLKELEIQKNERAVAIREAVTDAVAEAMVQSNSQLRAEFKEAFKEHKDQSDKQIKAINDRIDNLTLALNK